MLSEEKILLRFFSNYKRWCISSQLQQRISETLNFNIHEIR